MTPSSRFGGHIVQGHVDGVGKLISLSPLPDGNFWLLVELPSELERYVVWKGSIALNGTSLTVAKSGRKSRRRRDHSSYLRANNPARLTARRSDQH